MRYRQDAYHRTAVFIDLHKRQHQTGAILVAFPPTRKMLTMP
jgi:hypothetical protein